MNVIFKISHYTMGVNWFKEGSTSPAHLMLGNTDSKAELLPIYLEFNISKLHVLNTDF